MDEETSPKQGHERATAVWEKVLGTTEPLSARLSYLPYYLEAMAGARPKAAELAAFPKVVEAATDDRQDRGWVDR